MMSNILIVDDEKAIADLLEVYLQNENYNVIKYYSSTDVVRDIDNLKIDLAILDVMMPEVDGFKLCSIIRKKYNFPIIFATAKVEDIDKINGLSIGADDYVTKPFTPMELMARVNSQLRRYHRFLDRLNSGQKENPKIHQVGGLEVNEETVEVIVDGKNVKVTPIEFKILLLLIRNPGRVFPAEEIYERVWNERAINTDTVMAHIRNLREKIEVDPKDPKYIKVVWGVGYKLEKQ